MHSALLENWQRLCATGKRKPFRKAYAENTTTHYRAEGSRTTGCGREVTGLITSDLRAEVDCGACLRTVIFKSYSI